MMKQIKRGIQFLADGGLNLFASLACATLPEQLQAQLIAAGIPLSAYGRLILIGHGGSQLWAQLQNGALNGPDPVDNYSLQHTQQFIRDYLDDAAHVMLYPGQQYLIPLQQLGEWAGWGKPSPLGQSIHPDYGVWFAHRAAFLTKADVPLMKHEPAPRPCDSCIEKPCLTTCPVNAVQPTHFDMSACANFRLQPGSVCADRCLARLACPVAPQHRYTIEQIQYHYSQSLHTIRLYMQSD
jgi:hypothetical protein